MVKDTLITTFSISSTLYPVSFITSSSTSILNSIVVFILKHFLLIFFYFPFGNLIVTYYHVIFNSFF
nr:MAG TPA: hypothetical protein [Caudoviricetes sp.]